MDYKYLKHEVDTQHQKIKREFYEAYEDNKSKIIEYIWRETIKSVENVVKEYYKSGGFVPKCFERTSLFRGNWRYKGKLDRIEIDGVDDSKIEDVNRYGRINSQINTVICRDHDYYGIITTTIHIPGCKFSEFYGMINEKLREKDIRIESEVNKEGKRSGGIKIIADLGKL